jgi:hypothetical protein
VKNSIFQKCPKFIIPQYNELFTIIFNISESGVVKYPICGDSFIFTKFWKNGFFLAKVSSFASLSGYTYAANTYVSLFTIIVEFYMVSCNLNFFKILKFRQGYGRFYEKQDFPKCPKFIIPQYNEFFIIIYNISESGDVEFPIFGDSFIFTKLWKNEVIWKKSRVVLLLEVTPMLLKKTRVNLQYPSSFS